MKSSVKALWKMAGVCIVTLIWDIAMVFVAKLFIFDYDYSDASHIFANCLAALVFLLVTVLWNWVVIDSTVLSVKRYLKEKKEEK